MKRNTSSVDKLIRLFVAVALTALCYTGVMSKTLDIIALFLALILTVTSLFGVCPLYTLFGISTYKNEK